MKGLATASFKEAVMDYLFLESKEYPGKAALKIVGDRYRLTGTQRMVLFRGIFSIDKALSRKFKITTDLKGKKLYLDGYNVLFTIMNYLLGKVLFIGNDGLLRDAGAGYGKIEKEEFFYKAIDLLFDWPGNSAVESMVIYLDRSVPNSDLHLKALERELRQSNINGKVNLVRLADEELKRKRDGVIATSDSEIIAATTCRVFDAARKILEANYGQGLNILDLNNLL